MKKHLITVIALLLFTACAKGGAENGVSGTQTPSITVVNNRALLSWGAGSGLPDGYYVEQSTDGTSWTQIQTVVETSTYLDGLSAGTTYFYRVRAFNSAGPSAYSGVVTLTP